ncbi:hypothetical protein C9994_10910 [Marivirga lumbricoides]|uniref:Uncharacterized protein n=1 Tax=Marivirga lumbricoides TaxID=1046115 RepID=A0A2T4DP59_9BACT|nr:hypothetical protein C9994_10910 [Marivirga lumbricoides]
MRSKIVNYQILKKLSLKECWNRIALNQRKNQLKSIIKLISWSKNNNAAEIVNKKFLKSETTKALLLY